MATLSDKYYFSVVTATTNLKMLHVSVTSSNIILYHMFAFLARSLTVLRFGA